MRRLKKLLFQVVTTDDVVTSWCGSKQNRFQLQDASGCLHFFFSPTRDSPYLSPNYGENKLNLRNQIAPSINIMIELCCLPSTNERWRNICFEGNVTIFLIIRREASRSMQDSNNLKSFLNLRQEYVGVVWLN